MNMKQEKFTKEGKTFYKVTFVTGENEYLVDLQPTTHTATCLLLGAWCHCFEIDGREANSLSYRSPKAAVKNAWML